MKKEKKMKIKAWAILYDWGEIAILPSSFTDQYKIKKIGWLAITKRKANLLGKGETGLLGSIVRCEIIYSKPIKKI